jgi:hypothetical protein
MSEVFKAVAVVQQRKQKMFLHICGLVPFFSFPDLLHYRLKNLLPIYGIFSTAHSFAQFNA